MTTGLIICGALGREVLDIVSSHGWDAEVVGVSAMDHMLPERIGPDVEKRILELRQRYERLIVVYGDCGSKGVLDEILKRHAIERIDGAHCYQMYAGAEFQALMDEEPGTYFLTDFLVRAFRGTILKGMGLDRFPQLKDDYFANYKRIVYLVQKDDPGYREKAQKIADYLGLPLEMRVTGYGKLEEQLARLMDKHGDAEKD
jgi:hypothetical protein